MAFCSRKSFCEIMNMAGSSEKPRIKLLLEFDICTCYILLSEGKTGDLTGNISFMYQ